MQPTRERVIAILTDPALDDADVEPGRQELLEALVESDGWEVVRDALIAVLREPAMERAWYDAAAGLWSGVCDERAFDVDHTIAVLLRCLERAADLDENLVWSITCNLKQRRYLSEYEPRDDPGVIAALRRLDEPRD